MAYSINPDGFNPGPAPRMPRTPPIRSVVSFDPAGAIDGGLDLREKMRSQKEANSIRELTKEFGARLVKGDPEAIDAFAAVAPDMAARAKDGALARGIIQEDRSIKAADRARSIARQETADGYVAEDRSISAVDRERRIAKEDRALEQDERSQSLTKAGLVAGALYGVKTPDEYQEAEDSLVELGVLTREEAQKFTFENLDELIGMARGLEDQIKDEKDQEKYNSAQEVAKRRLEERRLRNEEARIDIAREKLNPPRRGAGTDRGAAENAPDSKLPTEGVDYSQGVGFDGAILGVINSLTDMAGFGTVAPEAARGRRIIQNLSQTAASVLQDAVPGRPSVQLMKDIKATLPQFGVFYDGEDSVKNKIQASMLAIETAVRFNEEDLASGRLTKSQVGKAEQKISQLSALHADMELVLGEIAGAGQPERGTIQIPQRGNGTPAEPGQIPERFMSLPLGKTITSPDGQKFIKTENGFEAVDGE